MLCVIENFSCQLDITRVTIRGSPNWMIPWIRYVCGHFFARFSGLIIDNGWVRTDMGVPTLNCCGEHQPYQPIHCSGIVMYSLLEVIGLGEIMKRGLSREVNNLRVKNEMCPTTIQTAHRSLSTSSTYFARIRREVFIYNPQLSHHITLILLLLSLYVWSFGSLKLTFQVLGKNM